VNEKLRWSGGDWSNGGEELNLERLRFCAWKLNKLSSKWLVSLVPIFEISVTVLTGSNEALAIEEIVLLITRGNLRF
jgi:hypothetical protein